MQQAKRKAARILIGCCGQIERDRGAHLMNVPDGMGRCAVLGQAMTASIVFFNALG